MGLEIMTEADRDRMLSRVMLYGAPDTYKTTAGLLTSYYPMALVSAPGEKGWGTIPTNVKGLVPFIWRQPPGDVQSAVSVKTEIETVVFNILAGKYDERAGGKIRTLFFDGYHKYYDILLDIVTGGAYSNGDAFDAFLYPRASRMSNKFLNKVLESPMEYVTFTAWEGREMDKPGDKSSPRHTWPDIPGRGAKDMAGNFSVVCNSRKTGHKSKDGKNIAVFGLKPDAEVWGNSVKMDPRLIAKLPETCPQDFKLLYKIIGAAQQEVEKEEGEVAVEVAAR